MSIDDPTTVNMHFYTIEQLYFFFLHTVVWHLPPALGDELQQDFVTFFLLIVILQSFLRSHLEDAPSACLVVDFLFFLAHGRASLQNSGRVFIRLDVFV